MINHADDPNSTPSWDSWSTSSRVQHVTDPSCLRQCERAGRPGGRPLRHGVDRLQRGVDGGHPFVTVEFPPHRHGQTATRTQRSTDVGERGCRVGEEHAAEEAHGGIESGLRERVHLRVALLEPDVREPRGSGLFPRVLDHPRREIDPEHGAGVHPPAHVSCRRARPAPDVDDGVVGREHDGRGEAIQWRQVVRSCRSACWTQCCASASHTAALAALALAGAAGSGPSTRTSCRPAGKLCR